MDLAAKGAEASLNEFKQLIVKLTWMDKIDFDLAALVEYENGSTTMMFYGNLGALNVDPFIKLDKDAGVGDTQDAGGNEETMRIAKLASPVKRILILAWDYNKMQASQGARFAESDVKITVTDDTGTSHAVTLDSTENGNVTCVCEINVGVVAATLKNRSDVVMVKGMPANSDKFMEYFKDAA